MESSDIDILSLPEPIQKPSANWARLVKKVFELDPLLCPKYGSQMRIKAFITNPYEIDRITRNLGIPNQRAPFGRAHVEASAIKVCVTDSCLVSTSDS